jgi:hypothetical protein
VRSDPVDAKVGDEIAYFRGGEAPFALRLTVA